MMSLKQDLERAMGGKSAQMKSAASFVDILGADVDTQALHEPLNIVASSAVNEISQAGQVITTATNLNVNILDENVLLDLDATCIAFNLNLSANRSIPDSGTEIFQFISGSIGKYTITTGNSAYLNQLLLHQRSKKSFARKANGMLLDARPHQPIIKSYVGADDALVYLEPQVVANDALTASNAMTTQLTMKKEYSIYAKESYSAANRRSVYQYVIPLTELVPHLRQFPDKQIYIGLGQFLNLQFQINPAEFWSNSPQFTDNVIIVNDHWSISNMQLIKVYTTLPDPMVQLILKSTIPMQKRDFYSQTQALLPTMAFNYTVPKQARLKALHMGFFWKNAAVITRTAANSTMAGNAPARYFAADVDGGDTVSGFKRPLGFFPAFHKLITFLQISVAGVVRTYNMQQLQWLWKQKGVITGEDRLLEDNIFLSHFKSPIKIPLDRISREDVIGSSSGGDQTVVQITIQFTNNPAVYVLPQTAIDDITAVFQSFICHTFLEYKSEMVCQNGLYETK